MADVFSPEKRSEIMRSIRGKNTRPELIVRRIVRSIDHRIRCNVTTLPGKPDIVLPHRKLIIFVHGCWWHGHRCKRGKRIPKSNSAYWRKKIRCNRVRDRAVRRNLIRLGWRLLVIWECQARHPIDLAACLSTELR